MVSEGHDAILGVLLNSFLLGGRQDLRAPGGGGAAEAAPTYGMSVTEPCLDWLYTQDAIRSLAHAAAPMASTAAPERPTSSSAHERRPARRV